MEVSVCGLCQLQVAIPTSTLSAELPVYHAQTDSLKMTPKKMCKSCHLLIGQIEQFAAHYQIKYCDSHFKSTAADGLKPIVPQPRQALQLLYASAPNNHPQRNRANSDSKNSLLSKRASMNEQGRPENEVEETVHPYVRMTVEEIKSKNLFCLSHLPKTLQLLIHLCSQPANKQMVSPEERR
jgi:hypothetical protein